MLRERTLARAGRFLALPCDAHVADRLAEIIVTAREAGRRVGAVDAIIAATALVHSLTVWTQDDDFVVLAELVPGLRVQRG